MVGWHHRLNGHEFEQTPGDGDGQESLVCCSPWGCRESDVTVNNHTGPTRIIQDNPLKTLNLLTLQRPFCLVRKYSVFRDENVEVCRPEVLSAADHRLLTQGSLQGLRGRCLWSRRRSACRIAVLLAGLRSRVDHELPEGHGTCPLSYTTPRIVLEPPHSQQTSCRIL